MEFEFDKIKSEANIKKHGIDFIDAQELWHDPDCIVFPAKTVGETRYLLIGKLAGQIWPAIFTFREQKIRIISVRRARKNEEEYYKN
jgi:uncharacterized DUF497 family protein